MRPIHLPSLLIAIAVASLLLMSAWAEDTPEAAYAAAANALPAPGADHALDFEGQAIMGGTPMGAFTFHAKPGKGASDEPVWEISESMKFGNGMFVRKSTTTLDGHLNPIRGRVTGKEPGVESFEIWWERTPTGFKIKHATTKAGETETKEKTIEHPGRVVTTMTVLWLFGKMTLPAKGTYAATVFEPDPGEGDPMFERSTWNTGDEGMWDGRKALTVKGTKGESKVLEGFFDPETRDLLGVRMESRKDGMSLVVRPGVEEAPAQTDDPYARPAKTAQEAALQAAMGFATGDLDLVTRVVHWPTVHEEAKKQHEARNADKPDAKPFPDVEGYKALIRESFGKTLPKNPRPMIEMALKASESTIEVAEQDDGTTLVTFPPMFRGMKLIVGEIDGVWYLVRFPGAPD